MTKSDAEFSKPACKHNDHPFENMQLVRTKCLWHNGSGRKVDGSQDTQPNIQWKIRILAYAQVCNTNPHRRNATTKIGCKYPFLFLHDCNCCCDESKPIPGDDVKVRWSRYDCEPPVAVSRT